MCELAPVAPPLRMAYFRGVDHLLANNRVVPFLPPKQPSTFRFKISLHLNYQTLKSQSVKFKRTVLVCKPKCLQIQKFKQYNGMNVKLQIFEFEKRY